MPLANSSYSMAPSHPVTVVRYPDLDARKAGNRRDCLRHGRAIITAKVQVMLTDEQYATLLALAEAKAKPVSVLVREAIVDQLLEEAVRAAKQKAAEQIAAMSLPVCDWPQMEEEIIQTHREDQPET